MRTVVQNLMKLDLSKRPSKEIIDELKKITSLPFMITIINNSSVIERAVPNTVKEPVFNTVSRLSYKPEKYNKDFQRASTPNNTMFYGNIIPTNLSQNEIHYGRIIGALESCDLIRDETTGDGERLITFGKWRVKEPLHLITIADPNKQYKVEFLKELVNMYNEELNKLPRDKANELQEVLKFISDEFSKKVNQGENFNYLISGLFSERIINNNNMDGILYPSVQTDGYGLCVAIRPKSMQKLELIKVLQCRAIRKDNKVDLENIRHCDVIPPNSYFVLEDIKPV